MRRIVLIALLVVTGIIVMSAPVSGQGGGQAAQWEKIEPGGETVCAHGTPYAFWTHEGAGDDLMIYFQGGGGCWNADTCRETGEDFNGFYNAYISNADAPYWNGGVLNLNRPENPFYDYDIVYIPVCTGDVHWGDNVHTYTDAEEGDVTINFKGFVNAAEALEWAYEHKPEPESVFVTGCSAGSVGSIVHAPYIIERYANTPIYQMGDSLSLLFTEPVDLQADWHALDNLPEWIPNWRRWSRWNGRWRSITKP